MNRLRLALTIFTALAMIPLSAHADDHGDSRATATEWATMDIEGNLETDDDGSSFNFLFTGKYIAGIYYLMMRVTDKSSGAGNRTGADTLSFQSTHTALYFEGANRDSSLGVAGDLDLYRVDVARAGLALHGGGMIFSSRQI